MEPIKRLCRHARAWILREEHKQKAVEVAQEMNRAAHEVNRAFTEHPHDAGETYWEHLWFTVRMSARFFYTTTVLLIHGIFPFLLTREGSKQIEAVYRIMKTRIPKPRRDQIDLDYHV